MSPSPGESQGTVHTWTHWSDIKSVRESHLSCQQPSQQSRLPCRVQTHEDHLNTGVNEKVTVLDSQFSPDQGLSTETGFRD